MDVANGNTFSGKLKWYDIFSKSGRKWLEERKSIEDIDGLWRIHDNLYDVTSFVDTHPGGKFWLEETKGLDVTEAFESHHVKSDKPEQLLKKYFVKKATKPRLSQATFHEDGFYRILKRNARDVLKNLPKDCHKVTDLHMDLLLLSGFIFSCLANAFSMYSLAMLASVFNCCVIIVSHNYSHQRDNIRMLYGNCFLLFDREFRILHVLSHHAFPNSRRDLQLTFFLPLVNLYPEKKNVILKYGVWIICNVIIFPLTLHIVGLFGILESLIQEKNVVKASLPLALPLAMHLFGGQSYSSTFFMWQLIILITSTITATIAFATTHIHPDMYIEGDRRRVDNDWGLNQIDTIYEKKEILGNEFLSLVTFGDHTIHHLFPTVDHAYLKYLYPVLNETLRQFNIKSINVTTTFDMYTGFFRQAAREIRKLVPPPFKKEF